MASKGYNNGLSNTFLQWPHPSVSVNEQNDPSTMSFSTKISKDAWWDGKGFISLMVKKKRRRKRKGRGGRQIEKKKIWMWRGISTMKTLSSLKEKNVERRNLSGCFWKSEWDIWLLKLFPKKKKKSFIINGQVLTFPAGFFCLLKIAPLQQLVEHKIVRNSGNNTLQWNSTSGSREGGYIAGTWRKTSQHQHACVRAGVGLH